MNDNDDEKSYELARAELVSVVEQLERGGLDLETALTLWERGEKLVHYCRAKLQGASERIEKILTTNTDNTDNNETTTDTPTYTTEDSTSCIEVNQELTQESDNDISAENLG